MLKPYQTEFIKMALASRALKFGEFTLKSGRISPYFFNAGQFQTGADLAKLGRAYAEAIVDSGIQFDMIFGPAYKGIPLASTTAVALADTHSLNVPYCYNRKEVKDHGEGGVLVGAPLEGKVLIVDDVITAGTAVREVLSTINSEGASAAAVVVGLDRQERGKTQQSTIAELQQETGTPVISIITLEDIMVFLESANDTEILESIRQYRKKYGA